MKTTAKKPTRKRKVKPVEPINEQVDNVPVIDPFAPGAKTDSHKSTRSL